jgi:hypothetical protein
MAPDIVAFRFNSISREVPFVSGERAFQKHSYANEFSAALRVLAGSDPVSVGSP